MRVVVTALLATTALLAYVERPLRLPAPEGSVQTVEFVDRNGLLLGTVIGGDRRSTGVPLARVAPAFSAAVLAVEDRRFYRHGALDALAAVRALARSVTSRTIPSGASTISMQAGRLLEPGDGPWGKVRETILARRLENGNSKRAILEAYCNLAPMGSNLYGVEAAARTYFGVGADRLDSAQSALLAALPNDPVRLDPYRHRAAWRARGRVVLARMRAAGALDAERERRAAGETIALRPAAAGLVAAPHFIFQLLPRIPPGRSRVRTTLDRELQRFVETQVREVVVSLSARNVRHAAAVVLDSRTGEVLAYAGSPDYFDDAHLGRNDGVVALRQPGSALKPFLYELALERRLLRPNSILADVPVAYALPGARVYRPADYSERFMGPVRMRIALANSLNVPAVRTLEHVGVERFRERLRDLGFVHLTKPADYYGLGLVLGAGEVSLLELTRAYATLARGGRAPALRETLDGSARGLPPGEVAAGDAAWSLVADVLADPHARAAAFGVDSVLQMPFAAAVKTGTSSDFRDTWTVGFTREYTVGVWAGNFDGSAMQSVSGVTGAAPIWARIMLHLHERHDPAALEPPRGYTRTPICAETGLAPAPGCRAIVTEWLAPDDLRHARAADAVRASHTFDEWLAQRPREVASPRILFPRDGDVFVQPPGARGQLQFRVAFGDGAALTLDEKPWNRAAEGAFWTMTVGTHVLRLRRGATTDAVRFSVMPRFPVARREGFSVL